MGFANWEKAVGAAQAMAASGERDVLQVDIPTRDFLAERTTVEGRLGQVDALLRPLGYKVKKVSIHGGLTEQWRWEPPQVPFPCSGAAVATEDEIAPYLTAAMYNTATPLQRLQQAATYRDMRAVQVRTTDLQWLLDKWLAVCEVTKGS
jgi:hypothetical protein